MPDWHMDTKSLFALALERGASDLHLKAGRPPVLRIHGQIAYVDSATLSAAEVLELARQIMDERLLGRLREQGSADFSTVTDDGERFRVNVYRECGRVGLAARHVVRQIRTFGELHLPEAILEKICSVRQGLIIFSGATGSGKSTSIASCIDFINARRPCHIVTLEDPIEFLFEDREAFINQREIETDVPSYAAALKALMREDPDVVLVGEMRDREAVEGVLRASETTRLVFTTVHAATAGGVVTRLVDMYPPEERQVLRESLASNLVAIICQKLLASADVNIGRVPATEILLATPTVRKMIREGDEVGLSTLIEADSSAGMCSFTQDLARLVREEWVDPKEAYEAAPNLEALRMAVRGINVKKGSLR